MVDEVPVLVADRQGRANAIRDRARKWRNRRQRREGRLDGSKPQRTVEMQQPLRPEAQGVPHDGLSPGLLDVIDRHRQLEGARHRIQLRAVRRLQRQRPAPRHQARLGRTHLRQRVAGHRQDQGQLAHFQRNHAGRHGVHQLPIQGLTR